MSTKPTPRSWILPLVLFISLGGALYSALGIGMVASLSPAPITRQWTITAYVYLISFAVSFSVFVAAVIIAWVRRRRARRVRSD